jgi:hypothetical protein
MGDGLQVPLNINLKSQEAVPNLRKAKIITAPSPFTCFTNKSPTLLRFQILEGLYDCLSQK